VLLNRDRYRGHLNSNRNRSHHFRLGCIAVHHLRRALVARWDPDICPRTRCSRMQLRREIEIEWPPELHPIHHHRTFLPLR
jgi:hypothetical protein